jgi:VanZ family protein
LLAMGIAVEVLQNVMNAGRHADLRDIAANALGIVAGIVLALSFMGGWIQRIDSWMATRG